MYIQDLCKQYVIYFLMAIRGFSFLFLLPKLASLSSVVVAVVSNLFDLRGKNEKKINKALYIGTLYTGRLYTGTLFTGTLYTGTLYTGILHAGTL